MARAVRTPCTAAEAVAPAAAILLEGTAPRIHKLLFVSAEGRRIHETTLQKTFNAAQEEAKLPRRATVHTLRHSYATYLVEHGISLPTIQEILGHRSLKTTEVYMHVTLPGTERLQEVLDKLMLDL